MPPSSFVLQSIIVAAGCWLFWRSESRDIGCGHLQFEALLYSGAGREGRKYLRPVSAASETKGGTLWEYKGWEVGEVGSSWA